MVSYAKVGESIHRPSDGSGGLVVAL